MSTTDVPPPIDDSADKIAYLTELARKRGYVLPQYGLLAQYDLPALKAIDGLSSELYLRQRRLSPVVKEIIFIVDFTLQRMPVVDIAKHVTMALQHGATPEELLEAIELLIPHAGIPTFSLGLEAWQMAVGAQGLEVALDQHSDGRLAGADAPASD